MDRAPMPEAPIDEDNEPPAGERQVHSSSWQTNNAHLDPKAAPALVQLLTKQELGSCSRSPLPRIPSTDSWIW